MKKRLTFLLLPLLLVGCTKSDVLKRSEIRATKAQISAFQTQIELFQLDIGQPPTTQQGLQALRIAPADLADPSKWGPKPYTKREIPKDRWGNDYVYEFIGGPNKKYRIMSAGPDGHLGTTDDIPSEPALDSTSEPALESCPNCGRMVSMKSCPGCGAKW